MRYKMGKEGIRHNKGKVQLSQLSFGILGDTARVFQDAFESGKYPKYNWQKGMDLVEVSDSLIRHFTKWSEGEDIDEESGSLHLDLMAANIHIMQYNAKHNPECDTREHKQEDTDYDYHTNGTICQGDGCKYCEVSKARIEASLPVWENPPYNKHTGLNILTVYSSFDDNIRELIDQLDPDIRNKWLVNYDKDWELLETIVDMRSLIERGFDWEDTTESSEFWEKEEDKWVK